MKQRWHILDTWLWIDKDPAWQKREAHTWAKERRRSFGAGVQVRLFRRTVKAGGGCHEVVMGVVRKAVER